MVRNPHKFLNYSDWLFFILASTKVEDHEGRIRKLENKDKLAAVAGAGMDGDQIELILKAIDDSQKELEDKINSQLVDFAPNSKLDDCIADSDRILKRVQNLERSNTVLSDRIEENAAKVESSKKVASRNTNDIENLKMQLKTGLKDMATQSSFHEPTIVFKEPEDGEGAASGEMINEVIKQIQRMEKSFSVRISAVESYSTKFVEINDNINDLNDNMTRALAPKGPTITQEDVDSWNDGLDKLKALEDQLKGLRKEINLMDGTKIKADILQLFKITQKMVNEDDISSMKDDMRRMKSEMADCNYDVAACKDIITKVEKSIDASQKENTQNINLLR